MSKQTAVELLIQEIEKDQTTKAKSKSEWKEIFEQAKQMEKEQITVSFNIGEFEGVIRSDKRNGTDYYNETYGGDDE
jgi:hypothetical protein